MTTDLLVRLAVDAGRYVRAETLLDELWDEPTGRNTLQSKVSQLRRALGDREVVAAGHDGYALLVPPAALDVTRAAELASLLGLGAGGGETRQAALTARDRGAGSVPRATCCPVPPTGPPRTAPGWRRSGSGLLEDALAARVELGGGGELVGDLEALVAEHPLARGVLGRR